MDVDIKHISVVLYQAVCEIIGDEDVVHFNRLFSRIREIDHNFTVDNEFGFRALVANNFFMAPELRFHTRDSGSRAEGFTFTFSDYDLMNILECVKVIQNRFQESDISESPVVLLTEKDNTRSGFVRLKVLHCHSSCISTYCLTKVGQDNYLSNNKLRDLLFQFSNMMEPYGPCSNVTVGGVEIDSASTLASKIWPQEALGCIGRLLRRGWPSHEVVKEMVSDGCLFVPIGCKASPFQNIEWRMSFSLAEKRLIYSMNHTQFLAYGLLKLFLKVEFEKHADVRGLICSYFLKTSVFWEIVDTNVHWTPCFLLQNVWNCFRRLLGWINNEYCPNFFIPENNMFLGKIHGHERELLLSYLSRYYKKGYFMFLEIPEIYHEVVKCNGIPKQCISHVLRRSTVIDRLYSYFGFFCRPEIIKVLDDSHSKIIKELKDFLLLNQLNLSCFKMLCHQNSKASCNKIKYLNEKALSRIVKASSPDCVRGNILMSLHLYRCKRYDSCICLLYKVIQKMEDEKPLHPSELRTYKYSLLGGEAMSIPHFMCKYTASEVTLDSEICIPEISLSINPKLSCGFHVISPWVLAHFLLSLCYFWKRDTMQAQAYLEDIRYCLKYRRQKHTELTYPISLELLGIGQEIIGDFQHALISYRKIERFLETHESCLMILLFSNYKEKISRLKAYFNME